MLILTEEPEHTLLEVEPQGPLGESDFATLDAAMKRFEDAHGKTPRLVIHAERFPGWDSFGALLDHMKFVQGHHKAVERIAFVSDSAVVKTIPKLARHFVNARVRHFPELELNQAKTWAADTEGDDEGMAMIDGLPDDVVGVTLKGEVTARDYEDILIPALKDRLERFGAMKLLYHIGPDFASFTAGAMWDDAAFGALNLTKFEKIAVVTDIGWIAQGVKLFAPLIGGEVRVYATDDFENARAWIATQS